MSPVTVVGVRLAGIGDTSRGCNYLIGGGPTRRRTGDVEDGSSAEPKWRGRPGSFGLGGWYGFFCWRLLGLIPGGAPFSQLSIGAKDAMVVFTIGKMSFYDKSMQKAVKTLAAGMEGSWRLVWRAHWGILVGCFWWRPMRGRQNSRGHFVTPWHRRSVLRW